MRVLDASGHTEVHFDTEVPESIEVATERFRRELDSGAMAVATIDGQRTQVREFVPGEASEYTFIPAMAGG
jgi:hypothetical protein